MSLRSKDRLHLTIAGLSCLALTACVTPSGGTGVSMDYEDDLSILDIETDPSWLGSLYEEADGLTLTPVAATDGSWRGQVLASEAPKFNPKYPQVIIVPVASTTSAMVCQVFETGAPVATVMRALVMPVLEEGGRHEVKYVAVHARKAPVLVVHGLSSGGPASSDHIVITFVKVVAAIGPRGSAVCEHHSFGYRETVEHVVVSLVQNLEWPNAPRPPAVVEVVKDEDGSKQVRSTVLSTDDPTAAQVFRTQLQQRGRGAVRALDYAETFTTQGEVVGLKACLRRQDGDLEQAEGEPGRALGCGSPASLAAAQDSLRP